MSPYERALRESLVEEKKELDRLYTEFAHSDPIRKRVLKGQIERSLQNIKQVTYDLEKYGSALSYLRETSKERDEMSEHLGEIDEKALGQESHPSPSQAAATKGPPPASNPVPSSSPRPTIGRPAGSQAQVTPTAAQSPANPEKGPALAQPAPQAGVPSTRPRIGQPVGTPVGRPVVGTPPPNKPSVGSPAPRPAVGTPVSRPTIGTPVGRPTIGTPIAKPATQEQTPAKKDEAKKEEEVQESTEKKTMEQNEGSA